AMSDAIAAASAIVIGPGLGQSGKNEDVLETVLQTNVPAVLDADALNRIAADDAMPALANRHVLTPHPGEMGRLNRWLDRNDVPTDDAGRLELAGHAARTFDCTVLLKGRRTVVTDGDRARINPTGNTTLAKAGSGDVLSGLIGSLLAQGMPPFDAACGGAFYHGLAGEHVGLTLSQRSGLASEVADAITHVMPKS
ncbi:MAG: NAD(P)H-hydrate dehydratase, partial [Planctomycetota bacterium]